MRRLWIGLLVLAVACGKAQAQPAITPLAAAASPSASTAASASATPTAATQSPSPAQSPNPSPTQAPSPQPSASATLLFAALEAKGTANPPWNTLAIAGLDGYAKAKTTFIPMALPYVGCAGPVLPTSAQVAAGKVFFADGTGVVRSLSVTGQVAQVATFPLTSSQQMFSFAVSPDGGQILASIFTIPPKPATGDPCSNPTAPIFAPGYFSVDVFSATSGSAGRLIDHQTFPESSSSMPMPMELLGWDQVGPVGTNPTAWATQGGGPAHYHGTPVRIDATTGKVLNPISDPSCSVWDLAPDGDYVCTPQNADISVRHPNGSEVWNVAGQPNAGYYFAFLSPDEQHLVALGSGSEVLGRDGTDVKLPDSFYHDGWLDSSTVIGGGFNTNLGYISLNSPSTIVDIGFKGLFIGTVRP